MTSSSPARRRRYGCTAFPCTVATYVRSTRLTQELRNSLDLVSRELRRAGYDENALRYIAMSASNNATSPFAAMRIVLADQFGREGQHAEHAVRLRHGRVVGRIGDLADVDGRLHPGGHAPLLQSVQPRQAELAPARNSTTTSFFIYSQMPLMLK